MHLCSGERSRLRAPVEAFVISIVLISFWGCPRTDPAPDLSGLAVGQGYDEVVQVTGVTCEHVSDAGVRGVVWSYDDGSSIEVGVYEGKLSGLTASGPQAQRRVTAVRSEDVTADFLHASFGSQFVTVDDTSDRQCRWRWDDGRLTALFERGVLHEAIWFPADGSDAQLLVEVTDEIELLLRRLDGRHTADRYTAIAELSAIDDPRVADAVLRLLESETDGVVRGKAALLLAQRGDRRANPLLLRDLEGQIINVDVLRALGQIGDLRAERALRDALQNQGTPRIRSEIQSARARIRNRLGMPSRR